MNLYEKITSYKFADFAGRFEDFNECHGTSIDVMEKLISHNIDQDNAVIDFIRFCEKSQLLLSLLNSDDFEFCGEVDHAVDSLAGAVFDMLDEKFYKMVMEI